MFFPYSNKHTARNRHWTLIWLTRSKHKNPSHVLELNQVSGIGLGIVKDGKSLWIVALGIVHGAVVQNLASLVAYRQHLHVMLALGVVTGQYTTVKDVLVTLRVRRRVYILCRVWCTRREVHTMTQTSSYTNNAQWQRSTVTSLGITVQHYV